ncbi:MAG TPA: hypothetical protein VMR34_02760 [Candidatus Saccharimonadales bacterium]|nr:hypothetical protein [Candidatus Saccharimonadales bacterium]
MKLITKLSLILTSVAFVFLVGISHHGLVYAASSTTGTNGTGTGIQSPTGADAGTYTYDPTTGLWENQYYTWSPITQEYTPITPIVYTYDPTSGDWDSYQWIYDAASGQYNDTLVVVAQPPAGAITSGGPTQSSDPSGSSDPGSGSTSGDTGDSSSDGSSTTDTGPGSTNTSTNTGSTDANTSIDSAANILNDLNAEAQTGNALVSDNTTGGDATSGDATSIADILNMIDTLSSLTGESPQTFITNLYGDVDGNLLINPSDLSQIQTSSNGLTDPYDDQVNSQNTGTINNDINLNSTSGNAGVNGNTTGGDATSGDADAEANIINMIDSLISANQSFFGVINIYGDLNGDILLPANFVNSLLSSNIPTASADNASQSTDINTDQAINNNVTTSATTGSATVDNNTSAGSATTGDATSNITVFNLTGSQVIGSNTLLVFVNVLGNWYGLLMDAPAGSTAAAYGGGITQDVPGANTTTDVNSNSQDTINDNIDLTAASGDATVSDNTNGGNATSGNAATAVNLLNLVDSEFDMSNWFGVLFINVFGTWNGSFGVAPTVASVSSTDPTDPSQPTAVAVFSFVPTNNGSGGSSSSSGIPPSGDLLSDVSLVSSNSKGPSYTEGSITIKPKTVSASNISHDRVDNMVIFGAVAFVGLSLMGLERFLSIRQKSN